MSWKLFITMQNHYKACFMCTLLEVNINFLIYVSLLLTPIVPPNSYVTVSKNYSKSSCTLDLFLYIYNNIMNKAIDLYLPQILKIILEWLHIGPETTIMSCNFRVAS